MNKGKKKPATVGGSSRDVALPGEQTEAHSVNQFCIGDKQNASHTAKLAVVDALLYGAEHTPPGFRSLTRSEVAGESWSMSWGDFIAGVARMFAGAALLSNEGAFALGKRLTVCFRDALQRGLEQGWERIRLASLDGVCRHHDATAPAILVAPGGHAFIWCPADFGKQKRVTLSELAELCAEQAFGATRRAA